MSEAEELKAFKKRLDAKYGKLAKKRLADISKAVGAKQQLVDMSDEQFNEWLSGLTKINNNYKNKVTDLINLIKSGKLDNGNLTDKNNQVTGHWVDQGPVIQKLEEIINEC